MIKYLLKRLLHGIISVVIVVGIVMLLVFTLIDRNNIFKMDSLIAKRQNNDKVIYKYQCWEDYGYLDYVPYSDWLSQELKKGTIEKEVYDKVIKLGDKASKDSDQTAEYVEKFTKYYESQGYTVTRLDAAYANPKKKILKNGGEQKLFAAKDTPVWIRMVKFFTSIIQIDNIHYVERTTGDAYEGQEGLSFTLYDPVYNTLEDGSVVKKVFSPAIIGRGTNYKYLLYTTNKFPFIRQNLIRIRLGLSYSIRTGVDVWDTMTLRQGTNINSVVTYPSGYTAETSVDLHSAKYAANSLSNSFNQARFTDNYTNVSTVQNGKSKMGYSFVIGLIAVVAAYLIGVPLGLLMARKKDKLIDKIGTLYIIFIMAVPSLAYIFMFRAIGMKFGLPATFDIDSTSILVYILPIVSLALPSVGNLMKWVRRYTIDQSNSDYVKFARSEGLSEREIFTKHVLKNAIIPIVHGIPGSILGALVGAIITERVYTVPGTGGMLTNAITYYDNQAIIGLTLFYSMLSIISLILGDIFMAMMDPRISFADNGR